MNQNSNNNEQKKTTSRVVVLEPVRDNLSAGDAARRSFRVSDFIRILSAYDQTAPILFHINGKGYALGLISSEPISTVCATM